MSANGLRLSTHGFFASVLLCLAPVVSRGLGPAPARQNASGGELIAEQAAFEVEHVELRLRVSPQDRSIAGRMTLRATLVAAVPRLVLDLDAALAVSSVELDGRAAEFETRAGRIWIERPAALAAGAGFRLAVDYGGKPRVAPNPPWNGGWTWSESADGSPWIATSCQGEGADLWWPCKDHPSDKPETMDLFVNVPEPLICASNGSLVSDEAQGDGTRTFHWHVANPISNYGVAINIGPFELIETEFESVAGERFPFQFWVLPENVDAARKILPQFVDHIRFFEDLLGPYPFRNEKYGVVETPHLGMEHQTIIAYGNHYRQGDPDYDWLHHHEASHEWWANLVTCRDWKDMWLHEGFGTYMQALYVERRFGPEAYRRDMLKKRSLRNRRPVAPRETHDSKEIYFGADGARDNDIYYKGAWILHSLRWLIGDERFFLCLRRMAYPDPALERVTDGSQVRFADSEEFVALAGRISERDLGWFFEVYLRQPALPRLAAEREGKRLELRWEVPGELAFPMPVPVRVGGEMVRVEMPGGRGSLELGASDFEIDPEQRVLRADP
jgi:aminopeptidase N